MTKPTPRVKTRAVPNPARRGDLVAVCYPSSYVVAATLKRVDTTTWHVGTVTNVTKAGKVTAFHRNGETLQLRDATVLVGPKEQFDVEHAVAELTGPIRLPNTKDGRAQLKAMFKPFRIVA